MGSLGLGIAGGVLSWNLLTWEGPPGSTRTAVYWVNVWSNYFGSDCDGSECMYEFFVGPIPFYTSVAYSLGPVAARLVRSRNHAENHPEAGG
jgi:hypothetical protein